MVTHKHATREGCRHEGRSASGMKTGKYSRVVNKGGKNQRNELDRDIIYITVLGGAKGQKRKIGATVDISKNSL